MPNLERLVVNNFPSIHPSLRTTGAAASRLRQQGVSLIELMIGLTIGLLVVLAATGTIVLNRTSSNTISDTASLTSQANNAMRLIAYTLRQAGAIELQPIDPNNANVAEHVFNLGDPNRAAPSILTNNPGSATIKTGTATVTATFDNRDSTSTRDCLGNTVTGIGTAIPSQFFIGTGTSADNLMCQGIAGNAAQSVAQNVEDLQILYLTEVGFNRQWLTAAAVETAGAWNQVVAADVCLQIRGDVNHGTQLTGNYTNCAGTATAHDRFLRLVLRQTVQLRNRTNNL